LKQAYKEKTKLTPAKLTEWNGAKNKQRQEDVGEVFATSQLQTCRRGENK
jgi:hypothetical protein